MSSTNAAAPVSAAAKPKKASTAKKIKRSDRAGLVMPVGRIDSLLKKSKFNRGRIGAKTSVFMAGVLQYVMEELLDLSKDQGVQKKGGDAAAWRISKRHVMLAIESDREFKSLFKDFCITRAGIAPTLKSRRVSDYKKEQMGILPNAQPLNQPDNGKEKASTSTEQSTAAVGKKPSKKAPKNKGANSQEHLDDDNESDPDDDFVHEN